MDTRQELFFRKSPCKRGQSLYLAELMCSTLFCTLIGYESRCATYGSFLLSLPQTGKRCPRPLQPRFWRCRCRLPCPHTGRCLWTARSRWLCTDTREHTATGKHVIYALNHSGSVIHTPQKTEIAKASQRTWHIINPPLNIERSQVHYVPHPSLFNVNRNPFIPSEYN